MTSDHCRVSPIQQRLNLAECSKCLKIILEILNENNSSNNDDEDEVYFKRKEWITVKDRIKQYEVNIETIVRTAILLKKVRKRKGRLVKNHIKEIIRDLERRIGHTIEIIKETKVTTEEQKYEEKDNEKEKGHAKKVIKSAFKPQSEQPRDDEQRGKPKEEMNNNIGKQSSERKHPETKQKAGNMADKGEKQENQIKASVIGQSSQAAEKAGAVRTSVGTSGQNTSSNTKSIIGNRRSSGRGGGGTQEKSAGTARTSASLEGKGESTRGRSTSAGGKSASTQGEKISIKERSASIGGQDAGSKMKSSRTRGESTSTRGRSASTGGENAGLKGKSAGTSERNAIVGGQTVSLKEKSVSSEQKRASTNAGSIEESASTKGRSDSTGQQTAGSKQTSASSKERSASTGGQSAGATGKSASTKGRSASTGDQAAGSKQKSAISKERSVSTGGQSASPKGINASTRGGSTSTRGRSASIASQSAGLKGKSVSTGERNANTGGQTASLKEKSASNEGKKVSTSAGSLGKSASTKGRSASTGEQTAGSKQKSASSKERSAGSIGKSASTKGRSASTGDKTFVSKKKSTSIKEISGGSGVPSAGSKEKSGIGLVSPKKQLQTKQNDKDKPKDGILKRENERSKHKTEGKIISSTTARRVTMSEATDKKGSTNKITDAGRGSLGSGEKEEIRGRRTSVKGRIVSQTQRQPQQTNEAQTTKDGGEIHRGKTNGRDVSVSKLTKAPQNSKGGSITKSDKTPDRSVKKEDSNRESHKKGVQKVRSEQQRQRPSQPAIEAQITQQTLKTQITMKGGTVTQHGKTNGPEVNGSGTRTSKQPKLAPLNSKVSSDKASKVKANIKNINGETNKSVEVQPKKMNAEITPEIGNRSEVKNVTRDLPDTKSESIIGGDKTKDASDVMKTSQSHEGHLALSIVSEPQKKPSKEPNQQTSQPTIRSSYLMKHVPTKKEKKNAKSRGCFTIKIFI